jgi:hypothetical protein
MPIRCGIDDGLCRQVSAHPGAIFHDELLAQAMRQPICHYPRHDVGSPAGGKTHNEVHGPLRIFTAARAGAPRAARRLENTKSARNADGSLRPDLSPSRAGWVQCGVHWGNRIMLGYPNPELKLTRFRGHPFV